MGTVFTLSNALFIPNISICAIVLKCFIGMLIAYNSIYDRALTEAILRVPAGNFSNVVDQTGWFVPPGNSRDVALTDQADRG